MRSLRNWIITRLPARFYWRNWRLASQLAILLVVMGMTPLALVTLYNEIGHREVVHQAARTRNFLQARNAAEEIEEFLQDALTDLRVLALMPAAVGYLRDPQYGAQRNELSLMFHETRDAHAYNGVMLADQTGKVVLATTPSLNGSSVLTMPAFQSAIAGNTVFGEPRYDAASADVLIYFSTPVRDGEGIIIGALIGSIPITRFDKMVFTRVESAGNASFGMLWNDTGILYSHTSRPDWRFRPLASLSSDLTEQLVAEAQFGPSTRAMLSDPLAEAQLVEQSREILYDATADRHVTVQLQGEMVHGTLTPLHTKRWVYGVFIPEPMIFGELTVQTNRVLQIALLVGTLAILAALVGARWWVRPLRQVADTARALAAGDMTRRVGVATRGEVGQLAMAFDAMAEALAEKDRQLSVHTTNLENQVLMRTAELSMSEERYRSLVQVSPDAILLVAWDGTILFCNERLAQLHGYASSAELIGANVTCLVTPSDLSRLVASSQTLARTGRVEPDEYTLLKKDGTPFPTELSWSVIRGATERTSTAIGVMRDITVRKQAQAQQQLQASALQAAANAIVITDVNGTIEWCNDAFTALTGYTMSEALGKNPRDLIRSGKQSRAFYAELWRTVLAGHVWRGQLINRRKDGSEYAEEMSITPVRAHGAEITHLVAIKQDVTERQRVEEQIHQHIAHQTALNAVMTAAVQSAMNLETVLSAALDEILRALQVTVGGIWVLPDGVHPRAFAVRGVEADFERLATHMTMMGDLAYEQLTVVHDWTPVDNRIGQMMRGMGFGASVLVPLWVQGKCMGGLSIAVPHPRTWTADEVAFMQTVGHQLGLVVERARLFDDIQTRAAQFNLLYQAGLTLNRSLELREQGEALCRIAMQAVHAEQAVVFLYQSEMACLEFGFGFGLDLDLKKDHSPQWKFALGEERGIVGWVAQTRKLFNLPDVTRDPRWIPSQGDFRSALWIPLLHEDHLLGVLVVVSRLVGAFTSQDEQLLTLFASQISAAMENASLYQNAVHATERRAILHRASQDVIAAGTDAESVYVAVHRAAAALMPCEAFVITLFDEARQVTNAVYLIDRLGRWPAQIIPMDQGLSGQVFTTGQSLLVDDVLTAAVNTVHFGDKESVRSILAVPLRVGGRVTGMISAQSYHAHAYSDEDRVLLEMLAAHAAGVLENTRLFEETRRRLGALEALSRISGALRVAQTLDQMTTLLIEETLAVFQAHAATIWLFDPLKQHLYQAATRGFPSDSTPLKPGEGIAGQIFLSGQVYVSPDFKRDPRTSEAHRAIVPDGLRGAGVPLRTAQESIGVLFVSVQEPRELNEDQVYILTTLAEMAGNAIHRQRLHNQTQHRLDQVQALRTVDMVITSSMDLDVTLSILLERAMTQLDVAGADVLVFNSHLRTLERVNGRGIGARHKDQPSIRFGDGWAGLAALERRVIMISDVRAHLAGQVSAHDHMFAPQSKAEFRENIRAYFAAPLIAKGRLHGVLELFHHVPHELDSDQQIFFEALANQAAIAMDNAQLFHELEQSNVELALAHDTTIEGWSRTLDLRDEETQGHTQRVTDLTVRLAAAMGMSDTELVNVRRGALLHDIGKMGVPDHILLKPGPLTDSEWEQMRRHPLYAYQVLAPIKFLSASLDIPYCHHERWDGTGYPRGLRGGQIPLTARIFTVVDVWDALTSDRPYRPAWPPARAREYIHSMSDKHFDPQVVAVFLRLVSE